MAVSVTMSLLDSSQSSGPCRGASSQNGPYRVNQERSNLFSSRVNAWIASNTEVDGLISPVYGIPVTMQISAETDEQLSAYYITA